MWAAFVAGCKALAALFGFGEKVTEEIHDHNQRVAGENKVIAQDNADAAKVSANVAKAAVDTTDDVALNSLRDGTA